MIVLGLESSCDETACAIVRDGNEILANIVYSQIELHTRFGGVVPELACRKHIDVIFPVIKEALKQANITLEQIDLIAVTYGPGLIGALLVGLNAAKGLAIALDKPFIGVNHVAAHLYAAMMSAKSPITFPAIGVVLSGGHTALLLQESEDRSKLIGQTVDDAMGEAFDKVAKILGLPYPGGPEIEKLALVGNPKAFAFKGGMVKGRPLDFSFSGLKTSVLYAIKGQNCEESTRLLSDKERCDIAASFQHAAICDVVKKTAAAAELHGCQEIIFGGGVVNNRALRAEFQKQSHHLKTHWPTPELTLDNAAMIAGLGYHLYKQKGHGDCLSLEPMTRIPF